MTTTLRHGATGQAVSRLQKQLNQQGATLLTDGDYGDATERAVRSYQLRMGLVADGIAGPKTQHALAGGDCALLLRNSTLQAAAQRLGLELAVLYAVNEVESSGEGFLLNGKPKILYERHIMHQRLSLMRTDDDDATLLKAHADHLAACYPNLVNTKPGGYAGGTAEHQRLAQAKMIDAVAALESTSWGAFQIMGYHGERLGYASVSDFAQRMAQDENQQFEAFIRFIAADPALHKALKAKRWTEFARRYNGPAYARNLYDIKLQRAYQRHADCECGEKAA